MKPPPKSRHFVEDPEVIAHQRAMTMANNQRDTTRLQKEESMRKITEYAKKEQMKYAPMTWWQVRDQKFQRPDGYKMLSKVDRKALKRAFKEERREKVEKLYKEAETKQNERW